LFLLYFGSPGIPVVTGQSSLSYSMFKFEGS
jgi:hypothetical protein